MGICCLSFLPCARGRTANLARWQALNPAWVARVWDRTDVRALWRDVFPAHKHLWAGTSPIQRADIARLMIVLHHGGLYADLDCTPARPIDAVLAVRPGWTGRRWQRC